MHDEDLTREEHDALRSLPREREPSELLEERTVRALRARGLLQPRRRAGHALRARALEPAWITAAAAAVVAVFATGFAVGQWLESRQTRDVLIALRRHDAVQATAMVERAGSAYIEALTNLANVADSSRTPAVAQGRQAAVDILHAAASQLVRLEPDDPLAAKILQGLDRVTVRDSTDLSAADRRLVWF
jgi:hypothetical protein